MAEELPAVATAPSTGLNVADLLSFIQQMEHNHQSDTEKLCKSLT